jgi:hypothetical protein
MPNGRSDQFVVPNLGNVFADLCLRSADEKQNESPDCVANNQILANADFHSLPRHVYCTLISPRHLPVIAGGKRSRFRIRRRST